MKLSHVVLSLSLLFPLFAEANEWFADSSEIEDKNYVGIQVASAGFDEGIGDTHGLILKVGHEFNNYLAIEGHLGSYTSEQLSGFSDGDKIRVEYVAGIYGRGNLFIFDPSARIYGLIGVTYSSVSVKVSGVSESAQEAELSYGIGIELYGNSRNGINLELIRYSDGRINDLDYTFDSMNLGYIHRF